MMCIPHHEQKPDRVQYHFMLEMSHPFSIISYWKRLGVYPSATDKYNTKAGVLRRVDDSSLVAD